MIKRPKLIYLEWCDSISNSSWKNEEDAIEWADQSNWIVKNVGWVIKETKEYICLASSISEPSDDQETLLGNLQKIPKTSIRKRRLIKI